MPELNFLQDLLILFGLSIAVVVAFHRANLPPLVGFLITGVVCGPYGFGLIDAVHEVESLAEIGVVLLLFTVGIEFSIQQLARMRTFLLVGGGLQVMLTLAAILALARLWGVSLALATYLGMLVSLSSTAIVIRLLADRGELDSPHGRASLGILIFQDLCIVPMLLLTPFLAGPGVELAEVVWVATKALVFVGAALIAARYLVPWLLHQVVETRKREIFLLTILLLCLGTAWAAAQVGLSLALGAFIAGLIISESEYSHQALGEILPFREVFNSLFFVSIGMLFDVQTLLLSPLVVAGSLLAILVVKTGVAATVTFALGFSLRVAVLTGLGLAQIGEFSFVLSKVGLQAGLLDARLNQLFLAVAVGTMVMTPGLRAAAPRLAGWLERRVPGRWAAGRELQQAAMVEKQRLEDHVIVIGYGLNGRNLARVLEHVGIPFVVLEMNPTLSRAAREKGVPVIYGDGTYPDLLRHVDIEKARVVVVAISDAAASRRAADLARRLNPAAYILVRSRNLQEMEPLVAAGAHEVVPEEFETSIEIFSRVLHRYLVPRDVIERCVGAVRRDGYEMFRSLYAAHRPAEGLQRFLRNLAMEVYRAGSSSQVVGKRLADSGIRENTGATVLAIQQGDGTLVVNPAASVVIREEDSVLLLGRPEQLAAAARFFANDSGAVTAEPAPEVPRDRRRTNNT